MAIYEYDHYGPPNKYGPRQDVDYDVGTFVANSSDYDEIVLTWSEPGGTWTQFRLLKSLTGYPAYENDGEILIDVAYSSGAAYRDGTVIPGRFVYYAIFVNTGSFWVRAAITSALVAADKGSAMWLWDHLPVYHKHTSSTISDLYSAPENTTLKKYLGVIGWGFDYQRTMMQMLASSYDPRITHATNVERLAEQLGLREEPYMTGRLAQFRVANASHVMRERGTIEGIRNAIKMETGWDADIHIGENLMLDDDQAEVYHPHYPDWVEGLAYHEHERVKSGVYWYEASQPGGAVGVAQKPPTDGSSNAWWNRAQNWQGPDFLNPATGGQYSWESWIAGPGTSMNDGLVLGIGVPSPVIINYYANNAYFAANTSGSTNHIFVRSVSRLSGQSTMDVQQPVKDGVPVPYAWEQWSPTKDYLPGDLVLFNGMPWKAKKAVTGGDNPGPTSTNEWQPIGKDARTCLILSGYTHQDFTVSGPTALVFPFVEWYDENGVYIDFVQGRTDEAGQTAFDSFTVPGNQGEIAPPYSIDMDGRDCEWPTTKHWSTKVGAWVRDGYKNGVARPVDPNVRNVVLVDAIAADLKVGVTFVTEAIGTKKQGLVFRYSNDSNYFKVVRDRVMKKVAGSWITNAKYNTPFTTPFGDGDRALVTCNGSALTIMRDDVVIWTNTDTFNASATSYGLIIEDL